MQQKRLTCFAWLLNQEGIILCEELCPQVGGNVRMDCQKEVPDLSPAQVGMFFIISS